MIDPHHPFLAELSGFPCIALDTVTSTNTEARARAGQVQVPTWVIARIQTAGRGRGIRQWHSGEGNFHATLIMPDAGGPSLASLRSFVAALAVREALAHFAPPIEMYRLKWPNDVLINGRKVSGILLETEGSALLIGIGVNLRMTPALPSRSEHDGVGSGGSKLGPVDLASETGVSATPGAFLRALAPAIEAWDSRLRTEGFAPIRDAWLRGAHGIGSRLVARVGRREITGVFETISETGAIMIATATGREVISAADIHFVPRESAHVACN